MTLTIVGIDALDPEIISDGEYPNLELAEYRSIETIESHAGEPSTHELWPSIITGLRPEEHGLVLRDDGVAWGNTIFDIGSWISSYVLPDAIQTRLGAWLLTNTKQDAFRTSTDYYDRQGISTVFDDRRAKAIGVPNYVVRSDFEDREHQLRRRMGDLFRRDGDAEGGHASDDADKFYELCMEMAMVRIARIRRSLRGGRYELVFGYTSALDLIGHVSYDRPALQKRAYGECDDFVGEIVSDLREEDELAIVSDHGLQNGVHTNEAYFGATDPNLVSTVRSVLDVRSAIETELDSGVHAPSFLEEKADRREPTESSIDEGTVKEQLEDLGYL